MSKQPSSSKRIRPRLLMALVALAAGVAAGVRAAGVRAGARRPVPGGQDSQPGGLQAHDPGVGAQQGGGPGDGDAPAGVPVDTPAELLADPDVIQGLAPLSTGADHAPFALPVPSPSTRIGLRLLMALVALAAGIAAVVVAIDLVRTVL
jgi:hypothetical protein